MADLVELYETTRHLLELEDTVYPPMPFPFGNPLSDVHHDEPIFDGGSPQFTPAWLEHSRTRICNWMFQVVDYFKQPREVVYVAMYFLDSLIWNMVKQRSESMGTDFRDICGTAFNLALKCHGVSRSDTEIVPPEIFRNAALGTWEVFALRALKFRLNPPTPQYFIGKFYWVFPKHTKQSLGIGQEIHTPRETFQHTAEYLIELSLFDVTFASYKASTLALAAIKASMHLVSLQGTRRKDQTVLDKAKARAKEDLLRFDLDIDSEEVHQCGDMLLMFYQDRCPEQVLSHTLGRVVFVPSRPDTPISPLPETFK